MAYSLDLREKVVNYVKSGGKKCDAAKIFDISSWCVNDWCKKDNLEPGKPTGRPRKVDWKKLEKDINDFPDKRLKDRAQEFGVWINSIWHAKKKMNITHKKNSKILRKMS